MASLLAVHIIEKSSNTNAVLTCNLLLDETSHLALGLVMMHNFQVTLKDIGHNYHLLGL